MGSRHSKQVCVLIHGLGDGVFVWSEVAEKLSDFCRVVAIDLRGHGDSDHDEAGVYSVDSYSEDVLCVLSHFKFAAYAIIGHSLGGEIAAKIMERKMDEIQGIAFIDSGPSGGGNSTRRHLFDELSSGMKSYNTKGEYGEWIHNRRPLISTNAIEYAQSHALRPYQNGYRLKVDERTFQILLAERDDSWWWSVLMNARVPILLVRGVGSAVLSKATFEKMGKAIHNAKLVTIKGAGHSVMQDNPQGLITALSSFLAMLVHKKLCDEQ